MARARLGILAAWLLAGCSAVDQTTVNAPVTTVELGASPRPPEVAMAEGGSGDAMESFLSPSDNSMHAAMLEALNARTSTATLSSSGSLDAMMGALGGTGAAGGGGGVLGGGGLGGTGLGGTGLGGTGGSVFVGGGGTAGTAHGPWSATSGAVTINGKAPKDATAGDVEKAIQDAGCTAKAIASQGLSVFEVSCANRAYEVSWGTTGGLSTTERDVLLKGAAIFEEDAALLAVRPSTNTDLERSRALLRLIRKDASGSTAEVTISVGSASVSGSRVSNASSVVAGMVASFRRCYRRGLARDLQAKGSLKLTMALGTSGEVLTSTASGATASLGSDVVSCVEARGARAVFDAPEGWSATVVVPVSFSSSHVVP